MASRAIADRSGERQDLAAPESSLKAATLDLPLNPAKAAAAHSFGSQPSA
jgi:hypothetical protein